uniref:hypothetical protein n=1 Tax=Gluconobacter thailandicus TaxID=257438 RepID=UPI0018D369CA|nr:hypothetical protein [Gluconobacter thailandicus]
MRGRTRGPDAREGMRAFGQGRDEDIITTAGGFEDDEDVWGECLGPFGDGVTSIGNTLRLAGRQIAEIKGRDQGRRAKDRSR